MTKFFSLTKIDDDALYRTSFDTNQVKPTDILQITIVSIQIIARFYFGHSYYYRLFPTSSPFFLYDHHTKKSDSIFSDCGACINIK
jgi:hypothetical protein